MHYGSFARQAPRDKTLIRHMPETKRLPSAATHSPPSTPAGIDWHVLSIDLRPFSVFSCPQSHREDRYRGNFSQLLEFVQHEGICTWIHTNGHFLKILSATMWVAGPVPSLHRHLHSCVTTKPGSCGTSVLLSADLLCFSVFLRNLDQVKPFSFQKVQPCLGGKMWEWWPTSPNFIWSRHFFENFPVTKSSLWA